MSLGERIYKLRTEKNLSQGELAERLDVSRQSVSKWENNNAVPDLEKIIALSEIFEVSLDELVKGKKTAENEGISEAKGQQNSQQNSQQIKQQEQEKIPSVSAQTGFPPRKIAGTILFCMGFIVLLFFTLMGGALGGLIFCLPFVVCGSICFACKTNVGLWCVWAVYVMADVFMHYATGINRATIRLTHIWTSEMNYGRLAIAWVLVIILAVIIAVTVLRFGKKPLATKEKGLKDLVVSWSVVLAVHIVIWIWGRSESYQYLINNILTMGAIYSLISLLLSWVKIIALTVALVITVRVIKTIKTIKTRRESE